MAGKQADIKVGVLTSYDGKGLQSAKTGLAGFKTAIGEAEGAGGKLAAGFGAVKATVVQHAGMLAVGAGAALVEFGMKAVEAFEHTAIAARNLSTATGLSIDDASRWRGVAKDMNVDADGLTTSLGKISKTIDDTKWKQFGVDTRDAGGQVRPVNDILLDTFDKLSALTNEGDRAREGAKLFGKGYAAIAPLIGHTRAEYESMLGSVEKGQVITEAELRKAEHAERAQRQLSQAFKEGELAVGGFLAQFIPLLSVLTQGVTFVSNLFGSFLDLVGGVDKGTESFKRFFEHADKATSIKSLGDELGAMSKSADESHSAFSRLTTNLFDSRWDGVNETFKKMGKESPEAMRAVYEQLVHLKEAADNGDPAAQKLAADYEINTNHLNALFDAYIRVTPAVAESNRETDKLSGVMGTAKLSAEEQAAATDGLAASQKAYTDAAIAANRDLVASEVGLVKAQQDEKDMLAGVASAARAAVDAKWAYNESLLATNKTIESSIATLKDHKSTLNDDATAVNAARDAAVSTAGAYATMNQHTLDSKAGLDDQIKSLYAQGTALAEGSPIRESILAYMTDLKGVAAAYDAATASAYAFRDSGAAGTHHDSYTPGVVANIATATATNGPIKGAKAGGGPVSVGNYLVGENGPEVVHMGGDGTVIPNNALGGVTVHNTFNGVTDPREIARLQARELGWALRAS